MVFSFSMGTDQIEDNIKKPIVAILLILLFCHGSTTAADYYVDAANGDDSWEGTFQYPKATIQAAIDLADDHDVVILAQGIYTGPGNRDLDFYGLAITVRGTDPADLNVVANTVIDPDATQSEPHRGFYFHNGEDPNSIVDGLTISNGYAGSGGAIKCVSSSPTITNCIIRGNWAGGTDASVSGGGIACDEDSSPMLTGCRIYGNTSDNWGGAISCTNGSNMTMTNCVIANNRSENYGGGIYCNASSITLTNCTFTANSAYYYGGGIWSFAGDATITNCIFWDNIVRGNTQGELPEAAGPEIATSEQSNLVLSYTDVKAGFIYFGLASVPLEEFGPGNIDDDPAFADSGYWDPNGTPAATDDDFWIDDYHLSAQSPCRNTGDSNAIAGFDTDIEGNDRTIGNAVDMGAWEMAVPDGPDLIGQFTTITLPNPIVPSDKGNVPIIITNIGDVATSDKIDIYTYLSTDQFPGDDDIIIGLLANQTVKLAPGKAKTFKTKATIPPDVPAGNYYLLTEIDVNNVIEESDETYNSNVVVGSEYELVWKFGDFDARQKVKLTVLDNNDVPVTFTLSSPGYGEIVGNGNFTTLTLNNTQPTSKLSVKTKGKGVVTSLGDILVNGSIASITGKTTNLRGDINVLGSLKQLVLGDVLADVPDGHLISIGASSTDPSETLSISLAKVTDLSIDSASFPIKSITATEWLEGNDLQDYIDTPWLGRLTIKGDTKNQVAGNFQANLFITGPGGIALADAKISGVLDKAFWRISGNVGSITAGAISESAIWIGCDNELEALNRTMNDFVGDYSIKSLTLKGSDGIYFSNSDLAAWYMGPVNLPQDAQGSGHIEYVETDKPPTNLPGEIEVTDL